MIIYKITNKINGKVYIGLTTQTLEYRWGRHLTEGRNINNNKHLYKSMRKYGENNFIIEQIDETDDFVKLGELERYYIKMYDSTNIEKGYNLTAGGEKNQYDGNSQSKLTVEDVIKIRTAYSECKYRVKDYWKKYYSQKMSYSGFQKVWDGVTWRGIMQDVYTKENIEKHKKQKSNAGSLNGHSLYNENDVLLFRKYYVTHTLTETYNKFGHKMTKNGFRALIDGGSYSHIPKYSKIKKVWLLDNKIIDIDNYKPVSTICESAE